MPALQEPTANTPSTSERIFSELRLLQSRSLEDIDDVLLSDAHRLLGVDCIRLFLFEPLAQVTVHGELVGQARGVRSIEPKIWAQAEGVSDNEQLFRLLGITLPLDLDGRAPALLLPITRGEQTYGGLLLLWPAASGDSPPDRQGIKLLIQLLGVVLENALHKEQLKQRSLLDTVTQAFSRRYFIERAQQEVARAVRGGWPVSSVYFDVDFMRHINDAFGSDAGDTVLREVVQRAQNQLRAGEVVARMGGEEFAVLLAHGSIKIARVVAERIRSAVCRDGIVLPTGEIITVTVSCGVADVKSNRASSPEEMAHQLMRSAEHALLQAKQAGRNRVAIYGERSKTER